MLQRAASNAYSWWWASHIRTKQSKWLEENLQDMDEKVSSMVNIIENEGDSFAERAEMYYRKRPELISYVEDAYRAYRALAERYDHLSKELQSANRTIATVFPEQVQFAMDDDDDDEQNKPTTSNSFNANKGNIPRVPSMPKKELRSQSMVSFRKRQLSRISSSAKAAMPPSSGLTKEEALDEINKIQKDILALQTEKEFVQSVKERCESKSRGIESKITEMQARVSSLQDEFGIANVIDDDEARALMASTALKSCQETLVKLQNKQQKSAEEAKVENGRIKELIKKFSTIQGEFDNKHEPTDEIELGEVDEYDMDSLRERIKSELDADSTSYRTVMQLAEKIDELVEKVAHLETEVSSQDAMVNRLRSDTDGFHAQIKTLEEDKETLMESSQTMERKLKELEEELNKLKNLNRTVEYQNNKLQMHFTEASCNIDHLCVKLQTVKPDEELKDAEQEQNPGTEAAEMGKVNDNEVAVIPGKHRNEKKYFSESDSTVDNEHGEVGSDDEGNWRQVYKSGTDDREKLLLEEYTLVLRNYKDVRKKLGDVEKKNRDGFFELALQIRELKNALAVRDEELQSLRKMSSPRDDHAYKYSHLECSPESMTQATSCVDNLSSLSSPKQPVFESPNEHHRDYRGRAESGNAQKHPGQEAKTEVKASSVPVSATEEKIRSDIDELLEENLEFWLRFSASFHQIRKFQTSVHDLKEELAKLEDNRKQEGSGKRQALVSEARPIYKHLREIQTELSLWLENNSVLKDDVQARYAALCNIQEEISRIISTANSKTEDNELSEYQAAKFQGEILNMKQESTKVADELKTGLDRVRGLKDEVEKILEQLDEEFGISASKPKHRARIPLRSFLFGVKLKRHRREKSSIFSSCTSPALQKQFSDLETSGKVSE